MQLESEDTQAALRSFEEVLVLSRSLGHRRNEGAALETLGEVHGGLGDATLARMYLKEALALRSAIGDKRGRAVSLVKLVKFHAHEGEARDAQARFEAALPEACEIKDRPVPGRRTHRVGPPLPFLA